MQPLSNPAAHRDLAQFLDPDGSAHSFRLEVTGGATTTHPTGRFGTAAVVFLGFIAAVIDGTAGVQAVRSWRATQAFEVVLALALAAAVPAVAWLLVHVLRWTDRYFLVHGPFARWDPSAGTVELPRLGVTLRRDQLVGVVCLTGGEWCGGWVRAGAWCPLKDGLPEGAARVENGWVQLNELSVIARADGGTLARFPVVTVQNPWLFREFAGRFADEFGVSLLVIRLTAATRRGLAREGWRHAGEFADADRPRKVAAGRVAVCTGTPFVDDVTLGSANAGVVRG
jgi:hypothetical protein